MLPLGSDVNIHRFFSVKGTWRHGCWRELLCLSLFLLVVFLHFVRGACNIFYNDVDFIYFSHFYCY